jgi:MFS family permease
VVNRQRTLSGAVLLMLFATGWAANHFTALLPVLARSEGLGRAALDGAFGIYAVGLLPGLLGGGTLSDRVGRRPLLLTGAVVAGLGNLTLLCWHDQIGIFVGRLIVGAGVGVAMSAGTAWSADIGGGSGGVLAGIALSSGFGIGPLVSGLLAQFAGHWAALPFVVTVTLSLGAALAGVVVTRAGVPRAAGTAPLGDDDREKNVMPALLAALPLAIWVFACGTVAMVTMSERLHDRYDGSWLPGTAAFVTLASGVLVQMIARRLAWGSRAAAAGPAAAAVGFGVVAAAGTAPPLATLFVVAVVLGTAYGLCLRQGLIDIETLAPRHLRGTLTGVFWAVTYLGFGLPVLLVTIEPAVGQVAPMIVLSVLASAVAVLRLARP